MRQVTITLDLNVLSEIVWLARVERMDRVGHVGRTEIPDAFLGKFIDTGYYAITGEHDGVTPEEWQCPQPSQEPS